MENLAYSSNANTSGAAIGALSPSDFGAAGPFAANVSLPPTLPIGDGADLGLDASDRMTLQTVLNLLGEAREGFASQDIVTKRLAAIDLVRTLGYLAGFLDGHGISGVVAPNDGFNSLLGAPASPVVDSAIEQIQSSIAAVLEQTPTRANRGKAFLNTLGDVYISLGSGLVTGAIIAAAIPIP